MGATNSTVKFVSHTHCLHSTFKLCVWDLADCLIASLEMKSLGVTSSELRFVGHCGAVTHQMGKSGRMGRHFQMSVPRGGSASPDGILCQNNNVHIPAQVWLPSADASCLLWWIEVDLSIIGIKSFMWQEVVWLDMIYTSRLSWGAFFENIKCYWPQSHWSSNTLDSILWSSLLVWSKSRTSFRISGLMMYWSCPNTFESQS